jgi:hypothetical protein
VKEDDAAFDGPGEFEGGFDDARGGAGEVDGGKDGFHGERNLAQRLGFGYAFVVSGAAEFGGRMQLKKRLLPPEASGLLSLP